MPKVLYGVRVTLCCYLLEIAFCLFFCFNFILISYRDGQGFVQPLIFFFVVWVGTFAFIFSYKTDHQGNLSFSICPFPMLSFVSVTIMLVSWLFISFRFPCTVMVSGLSADFELWRM